MRWTKSTTQTEENTAVWYIYRRTYPSGASASCVDLGLFIFDRTDSGGALKMITFLDE
jgi:hypothetical protein